MARPYNAASACGSSVRCGSASRTRERLLEHDHVAGERGIILHFSRFLIIELAPKCERRCVVIDNADAKVRDLRPARDHLLDEQRKGASETAVLPVLGEEQQSDDGFFAHRIAANHVGATDHVVAGVQAPYAFITVIL